MPCYTAIVFDISHQIRAKCGTQIKSFFNNLSNGGHSIIKSKKFPFQFTIMWDPIDGYLSHFNWHNNIMGENWYFEEYLQNKGYKDFQFKYEPVYK